MPRDVFTRILRDNRATMIGWSIGLVAYLAIELAAFPSIKDAAGLDQMWEQMPDAVKAIFGMESTVDFTSGVGFLEAELFGFTIPLVVLILAIVVGSKVVAGTEDEGLLDLVLAQPVSRVGYFLRGAAAAAVVAAVPVVVMLVALVVGAQLVAIDVPAGRLALASLRVALLAILFATLAAAAGAAVGGRARTATACVVVALSAFVATALGRLVTSLEVVGRLSPFEWLLGAHPITSASWGGLVVAAALITTFLATGAIAFDRRDLR